MSKIIEYIIGETTVLMIIFLVITLIIFLFINIFTPHNISTLVYKDDHVSIYREIEANMTWLKNI